MTDNSSEDHELIRRYLVKGLTEAEELMLETRIVEDPLFRSEVELTAALKDGMRALDSHGEVSRLIDVPIGWWSVPRVALAASLGALALGLGSLMLSQQREKPVRIAVTETLHFEQTRGSGAEVDVVWERSSTPTQLELRFDVGAEPAAHYHVTIARVNDNIDRTLIDRVVPSAANGEVLLVTDGALLEPGDYEIRLEPRPEAELAEAVTYTLLVN